MKEPDLETSIAWELGEGAPEQVLLLPARDIGKQSVTFRRNHEQQTRKPRALEAGRSDKKRRYKTESESSDSLPT
jgi:hypothetical protein